MVCQSCNTPIPLGAQYCFVCGARVTVDPTPPPPPQLAERKFVTVVFIDMVGSLSAIQDKDPEDAHEVLASALSVMTQAVHAYGGVVTERQGDGIMAVFGAPAALEDHATRACYAALRLHSMVQQELAARISIRIGMNSGEVAVGSALSDFANDYTATGAVVHIAARLQSLAAPNSTVMTAQTAALVRDAMRTESIGASVLKGLERPVDIHRLIGPVSRQDPSSTQMPSAFVGRDASLAQMEDMLAAALEGHGLVLALSGEAGVGKSTLIQAFASRLGPGISLIRATAQPHASAAPFKPFADLLSQLLKLDGLAAADRKAALKKSMTALGLHQQGHESALHDLLDLEVPSESWSGLAPLLRHGQIGAAVMRVLQAESRRRRLVVVLEDLQRADSATIELVGQLGRTIARHPLLVIVAFRPELVPAWHLRKGYQQLRLARLSDEDTRALVMRLLGDLVPRRVQQKLVGWSKGNPLFVRESVRAMVEAGAAGDSEAAARIEVPPSVGAVIAARIDRLPSSAKRTLLAASVLGKQFAFDVLLEVVGTAESDLVSQLNILVAAEFVHHLHLLGRTYGFDHGLFQEIGYATLLRRQRRELHQAAFNTLSRPGPSSSPVEELAYHAYGGELWTQAVPLCREAGLRAASRYSNREAALHLENATSALDRTDPDGHQLELAIALRLELRSVSIPLLRMSRVAALLAEAQGMAERLDDVPQRARITAFLAGHAYLTQSPARCLQLCREAVELADLASDPKLRIAPTLYTAQAQYGLGQYRKVIATLEREPTLHDTTLPGAALGLPLRPLLMRGYWQAISLAELGRFTDAEALADEMLALSDERQPFESLYALTAQGFVQMLRGAIKEALQSSSSALAIAEQHDIAFIIPVLGSQVGYLLAAQGSSNEGLVLAQRAVRTAEEIGINAGRSRWCARLAEVCLFAKELALAKHHAETAIRMAEEAGELGYLCSALRLRAKTNASDGNIGEAFTDVLRAAEIARTLRLGPALAKCHFDHSSLLQGAGQLQEARRGFQIAGNAFQRYGMASGTRRVKSALSRLVAGSPGTSAETLFGSAE